MDIANPREDRMSECRSFGSNCQHFSQSRKVSIGVLVNSVPNSQTKSVKETAIPENRTYSNENRVKNQGHSPITEKGVTLSPNNVSPWVSTRSFKPKASSMAVHDADRTSNFPSKTRPRSKLSAKVSIAHSVQFFGNRIVDKKCNDDRHMNYDETENVNNAAHEKNLEFSTEPQVLPEKKLEEDRHGKTETEGNETLRMKLWEILGNGSSPDKQCTGSQPVELPDNQERDIKECPIEKTNQKSDTIESDSEKPDHTFKRPLTRSLTLKNPSTRKHHKEIEAKSSTSHRKECIQKDIFSFTKEWPERLHDTVNDGSLPCKRKKIGRETSQVEKIQDHLCENTEKRQQSENKRTSVSSSEKSNIQRNKGENANCSRNRRSDVFAKPKLARKEYFLSECLQTEQKKDLEIPNLKDQQEDVANSLLKNKIDSGCDPTSATKLPANNYPVLSETKGNLGNQSPVHNIVDTAGVQSFKNLLNSKPFNWKSNVQDGGRELKDCLPTKLSFTMEEHREGSLSKSSSDTTGSESSEVHPKIKETKKGNIPDQSPVDSRIDTNGVRSFKSLLNSKPSDCKSNAKDGEGELKDCLRTKSRFAMEEDRENSLSKYSSDTIDSESSEDDSNIKGHRKPEQLYTETRVAEKFLRDPNKRLHNLKSVEMTECSPISESSREIEENSQHQAYLQQNQEDGLAGAVAQLAVALNRVKTKLKSVSSTRSAEILRVSAEEMLSQLQNAESQIKTDMGKLSSLSKLKRKRMETRFQEQHDQLLGIFKRFKEEVGQRLNDCSIFEDLEEHETELKGIVEKQRETHMKLLTQVDQAIKVQLDDTESKIMVVQDSARKKMLQLKLVVAECAKAFSAWSN